MNSEDNPILLLGASGATGRLLLRQLLERGCRVRAVVRRAACLPDDLAGHAHLELHRADLPDLTDAELAGMVRDCRAIASCLGHKRSFKGMFDRPRPRRR